MDMRVKDFDEFKRPSRKPWLLLLILLVVGGVFLHRRGQRTASEPDRDETVQPSVSEDWVDRPDASDPADQAAFPRAAPLRAETPADLQRLLERAREREEQDDLVEARRLYLATLDQADEPSLVRDIQERLGRVNIALLTTPRPMPEKEDYVVRRGDFMQKIARHFGTTTDLVELSNNIRDRNLIRAGDRLRVFTGTFSIHVSKTRRELIVSMNGQFFKRYPVGIGKHDKTPEGTFVVAEKQKEPVWWPAGREIPFGHPENILGTRWMSLRATGTTPDVRGYGIHGTWEPESIGKAESAGCIRMKNSDVEELYVYITIGTPVTIDS